MAVDVRNTSQCRKGAPRQSRTLHLSGAYPEGGIPLAPVDLTLKRFNFVSVQVLEGGVDLARYDRSAGTVRLYVYTVTLGEKELGAGASVDGVVLNLWAEGV